MDVKQRIKTIEEKLNRVPPHDNYHTVSGGDSMGIITGTQLLSKITFDGKAKKVPIKDEDGKIITTLEITPQCSKNCVWDLLPRWG